MMTKPIDGRKKRGVLATEFIVVHAKETLYVSAIPQTIFKPSYAVIPSPHPERFLVHNILVGYHSQFVSSDPVNGIAFAAMPRIEALDVKDEERLDRKLQTFLENTRAFDFETILVNQPLRVCVENLSDVDSEFKMVFWGDEILSSHLENLLFQSTEEGFVPICPTCEWALPDCGCKEGEPKPNAKNVLREMLDRPLAPSLLKGKP